MKYLFLLTAVLQVLASFAQPLDTIINNAAMAFMRHSARVGLSVGIVDNGHTYMYHYGSISKTTQQRPNDHTIYEIGSVSKTFTGLLLAHAITDRKITLDDDVRQYITGKYPNLAFAVQPVRIKHLASHTSGLPAFLPDRPDLFQHAPDSIPFLLAELHKHYTREQFLNDLHTVSLDTIPGAHYRYSNVGAQLLAIILENVYHQSLAELTRKFITAPLQMNNTHTDFPANDLALAQGHDAKGRTMPRIPADMSASGGIYSSLDDMLKYLSFQLDEGNESARISHTPTDTYTDSTAIGLFWRINQHKQFRKIWHTGGTFGFSSYCALYPEAHFGIILLSNEFDPGSQAALVQLAEKIFSRVTHGKRLMRK